jgi:hypothetical protein
MRLLTLFLLPLAVEVVGEEKELSGSGASKR